MKSSISGFMVFGQLELDVMLLPRYHSVRELANAICQVNDNLKCGVKPPFRQFPLLLPSSRIANLPLDFLKGRSFMRYTVTTFKVHLKCAIMLAGLGLIASRSRIVVWSLDVRDLFGQPVL